MTNTLEPSTAGRGVQRAGEKRAFRADIQALRTVAITAVVLNHLWPTRFGGGYVGVDVFFVISGYLITAHLFSELSRTGRIRLGAFYARRIRRLLPASLLVLAVSAVLVWVFLPYPRWDRNAAEIAGSAAYVENWVLSSMSVNYSALNDAASAVQHFWSLSVEEQFYLVWPALLLVVAGAGARWAPRRRWTSIVTGALVAVLVVSLAASVLYTQAAPRQAYFVTFTRAWEFAVGGVLALVAMRITLTRGVAEFLSLGGFLAIGASVLLYGPNTPFPGSAALLPVVGTAAIIAAGTSHRRLSHAWLTDTAPVQWVGAISYSLYLWHWPLIVIAPFALQRELSGAMRVGVLIAAVLLAWATKVLVEDPARTWKFWVGSTRRSVTLMCLGIVTVIALAGGLVALSAVRRDVDSPDRPVTVGECAGPAALDRARSCPDPYGPAASSVMTEKNKYYYSPPECAPESAQFPDGTGLKHVVCDFSSSGTDPKDVWIVGDSHAQQWQGAVFELARERGWRVTTAYLGGCPAANVAFVGFRSPGSAADAAACRAWSRSVSDAIAREKPEAVFTAMAARLQLVDDGSGRSSTDQFVDGLLSDWARWSAAGSRVFAFADPPFNAEVRDPDCILLNAQDPAVCARPRTAAQPEDPVAVAGNRAPHPAVTLIDLTEKFCDAEQCYAVVGGVPVYYDADHLNLEYVRMLAPDVAASVGGF